MKSLLILLLFLAPRHTINQQDNLVLICVSPTAHAYHSYNCQGLRNCTHTVKKITLEEAKRLRKKPCGYCYGTSARNIIQEQSDTRVFSGQCQATTKKGTRCSRSSRSNGYCWQHGG